MNLFVFSLLFHLSMSLFFFNKQHVVLFTEALEQVLKLGYVHLFFPKKMFGYINSWAFYINLEATSQ